MNFGVDRTHFLRRFRSEEYALTFEHVLTLQDHYSNVINVLEHLAVTNFPS